MSFAITGLGTNSNSSGSTLVLTTGVDCPPGSLLVIVTCEGGTAAAAGTIALSAGGSPTQQDTKANGNIGASGWSSVWTIYTTADLPSGGTITYTKNGLTTDGTSISAFFVQGGDGFAVAVNATPTTGTTGSPSISATVAANQIDIGIATNAIGVDTWTQAGGWTSPNTPLNSSATVPGIIVGYNTVQSGSLTYSPTLNTSLNWAAFELAFNAQPYIGDNVLGKFSAVIRRPRVISGGSAEIASAPFPPPVWSSGFFDRAVIPPFPSKEQKFDTYFQPQGRIFSKTPQGWERFFDKAVIPPFPSKEQTFEVVFEPLGNIFSKTPQGWWSFYDVSNIQPFPSKEQKFDTYFQPRGNIFSKTPQGWSVLNDVANIQPFPSKEQQFRSWTSFLPPPVTSATQGWLSFYDIETIFPKVNGEFQLLQPLTSIPQGWGSYFDGASIKAVTPSLQKFDYFQPQGNIFSITPQGWSVFYDAANIQPFPAKEQKFDYWALQQPGTPTPSTLGWYWPFSNIARRSRVNTGYNVSCTGTSVAPAALPNGWSVFYDASKIQPLKSNLQKFDSWTPFLPPAAQVTVFPNGWSAYYDVMIVSPRPNREFELPPPLATLNLMASGFDEADFVTVKPFDAKEQSFATQPFGRIISTTPQGWWAFYDVSRIQPFPTIEQRFDYWAAQTPPAGPPPAFPYGWTASFDAASGKAFVQLLQKFDYFQPQGNIFSTTPQGWSAYFDRSSVRAFNQSLQLFNYFQLLGTIGTTPQGWSTFYDTAKIQPLTASQQKFDYNPIRIFVAPFGVATGWMTNIDRLHIKKPTAPAFLTDFMLEIGVQPFVPSAKIFEFLIKWRRRGRR